MLCPSLNYLFVGLLLPSLITKHISWNRMFKAQILIKASFFYLFYNMNISINLQSTEYQENFSNINNVIGKKKVWSDP